MIRTSTFTDFFEMSDGAYAVSLISGAVIFFGEYSSQDIHESIRSESFCEKYNLFKLGIVTKLSMEEEQLFAEKLLDELWSSQKHSGGVVLLPTFLCNLDCEYCYQKDIKKAKRVTISEEEIAIFLDFIKQNDIKHVTLFGGEPLMKANLKRLMPVLDYFRENNIKCSAVTNGTEIDAYRKYLGDDCISAVQITLDGDAQHHNAFRKRKNGRGSWDEIYRNIQMLIECGVFVSVRMNVNSKNIESCTQTKVLLEKKYNNTGLFKCYMGKISGECGDLSYSQRIFQLNHPALQKFPNLHTNDFFPRGSFCSRTARIKSLVFAPTGIWDCWHHVGDEDYRIGSYKEVLHDDEISLNETRDHLKQFSRQCLECKYLFICSGDCSVYNTPQTTCDKEERGRMFYDNISAKLSNCNEDSSITETSSLSES
ncbi:MAG: radical SAM protein [Candidatus Babeliaceae bacterium]|nr:radical SAM protein [Candidatus Babeliaceae bacterium]